MSDLFTLLIFSLLLIGFGYACTIGAKPEGARITVGALLIVSGALLAVGSIVLTIFSLITMGWGAKW